MFHGDKARKYGLLSGDQMAAPQNGDLGSIIPYGDGWAKITNLFTEGGDITTDALEAVSAVAYIIDGPCAGMYVSWEVEDPDELVSELYLVC